MSYQDKVDAALTVIKQHNSVVGEAKPGFVQPDDFIQSLKAFGA